MFLFKADNIYDVVKPLHYFSQSAGLTSFTIKRRYGVFIGSAEWFNIVLLILISIYTLFIMAIFVSDVNSFWLVNHVHISEVFENSMFCVILSMLTTSIIFNWWTFGTRIYFARALNLLFEVDQKLLELKVPINLRQHRKVLLIFAISVKSFSLTSIFVTRVVGRYSEMFQINLLLLISLYLCIEMAIFGFHQFTFWMWALKLRYQKINLFLEENFINFEFHNVKEGNEKLCHAAQLHDKLVDVSECINRCYGVPVKKKIRIRF